MIGAEGLVNLGRNIVAGFRLATFLPVRSGAFRGTLAQAVLLLLISFSLNFAYDYFSAGAGRVFNVYGLTYQGTLYFLFLCSLVLMGAIVSSFQRIVPLTVQILAVIPTTFVIFTALLRILQDRGWPDPELAYWGAIGSYMCWHLAVVVRALRLTLEEGLARTVCLFLVYAVFNVLPWFLLPSDPIWEPAAQPVAARDRGSRPDVERLFLNQPGLLSETSGNVLPGVQGVREFYFIGFAGYAGEDVFMHEAQSAERVFARHFGTIGRSVLLINNPASWEQRPLASPNNLAKAIAHVGARMNLAEDVLVLYLTSHGEQGVGLSVDLGEVELSAIEPAMLQAALDRAAIEWRVVIVSACYSGMFADALRGPRTLVIASSRADRSSFGCGHDGDYTYFGEAYLGLELPKDGSLMSAFERARRRIEEREKKEGLTPSEPQLAAGAEIEALLEQMHAPLQADSI